MLELRRFQVDPEMPSPRGPCPLGSVEAHAGLLILPPEGQLLYKVMTVENLLRCIDGSYLHFNRVDSYKDGPGSDPHDGGQLPGDEPGNSTATFEKAPSFSAANYYDVSRQRTYACCFGLENADYLWNNYGGRSGHGKVGVVFDFARLRSRLNQVIETGQGRVVYRGLLCRQIFGLNYGVVQYVDRLSHRANTEFLPNPIQYIYLKGFYFSEEKELRVSLSAIGLGHFKLNDGSFMEFLPSLHFEFDFRAALADGTIRELMCLPETDTAFLEEELKARGIAAK